MVICKAIVINQFAFVAITTTLTFTFFYFEQNAEKLRLNTFLRIKINIKLNNKYLFMLFFYISNIKIIIYLNYLFYILLFSIFLTENDYYNR